MKFTLQSTLLQLMAGLGILSSLALPVKAQDPNVGDSFSEATQGMKNIAWYRFGTASGCTICNLQQLGSHFNPYGIAGKTVIHQEWERYQPFNNTNFGFTGDSLNITATIAQNGGLWPGGINSGQIWSQQLFKPGVTGYNTYAFTIRMKIPQGQGMWPATWLYPQKNGDGSEIDIAEFETMQYQTMYDWTGFDEGRGVGSTIEDIRTNPWVWHPGTNFSAGFHDYQLIWTRDATFKYVDGRLIYAQFFKWNAASAGQLGINLAVGSNSSGLPGLHPNSLGEFPAKIQVESISISAK